MSVIEMGSYPKQEFIYGICFNTDLSPNEDDEDGIKFDKFLKDNDLDFSTAGNMCEGFKCGIVIGFEYEPEFKDGYIGGYHIVPFSIEDISNWFSEVTKNMDEDLRHKIVKFMEKYYSIDDDWSKKDFHPTPKLWTISSFG